jgi:hypothetical protein
MCRQWWQDHSLSITCLVLGITFTVIAWQFEEKLWDTLSGLGLAFLTVAIYGLLQGPLVERNKPEEPPP